MSLVVKMASRKTKIQYPWLSRLKQNLQCQATKKKLISHSAIFYDCNHKYQHLHHMGVSKNDGTPKSVILIGFSIIFTIHFGYPYFWKHPYIIAKTSDESIIRINCPGPESEFNLKSSFQSIILSSLNFGGFRLLTNHRQKKMKVWKIILKKNSLFKVKSSGFIMLLSCFYVCLFLIHLDPWTFNLGNHPSSKILGLPKPFSGCTPAP